MKNTKIILLTLLMLGSLISCSATNGNKSNNPTKWVVLGKRTVSKIADHDEIRVTASKGTFRKIKLKVTQSPIFVTNVRIVYANGTSENHVINKRVNKGRSSRVLDLKGKKRIIKKIVFNYRTKLLANGKARITVLGKH